MARNYYVVLGVPRSESDAGIRAAFRDLVKRHHPDRVGTESSDRFREVVEAYEVLSDPERRQRYNHTLPAATRSAFTGHPHAAEPLVPESPSIFSRRESVGPSYEETWERWARNFTGLRVPKSERAQGIDVEVILDPDESRRGVALPIGIPVLAHCPSCAGTGRDWVFACGTCDSRGIVEARRTISLSVPPGVTGVFDVPLDELGIANFVLRARVRVGRA